MKIYTKAGELAFKEFDFSDSQPHFKLETIDDSGFRDVTIEMAIRSPRDLLLLVMVSEVLRNQGFSSINLDIRYLLGARMDRALSTVEPFTLEVVARIINSCGFTRVRILDVHSSRATDLIRNSENVLPHKVVDQVYKSLPPVRTIIPDKGAYGRVLSLMQPKLDRIFIKCDKVRLQSTGELTSFKVDLMGDTEPFDGLIIDDICDGGGTFVGLAKELRKCGAKKVYLYVTHGIFSKGLPLEGIDKVFTTDSLWQYNEPNPALQLATVIPVSMKDLS